ncbi:MAG TPA: hypothetical protein VK908_07090 [Jiangellales bacterium]|nr:hypothetical protein [Jiangellales bacterium]
MSAGSSFCAARVRNLACVSAAATQSGRVPPPEARRQRERVLLAVAETGLVQEAGTLAAGQRSDRGGLHGPILGPDRLRWHSP